MVQDKPAPKKLPAIKPVVKAPAPAPEPGLLVVLAFFGNLFMPLSGTLLEIAKFTPMYGLKGLASWPQMEGMTTGMNAAQEDSLLGLLVNVLAWTAIFAVTTLLAARRSTARA